MSDQCSIRTMTPADLPLLARLRAAAGWNQTEADLRRFLTLAGPGAFVASLDGADAGTVCTFVFGSTAWVAMMLVDEALRGRGIGTALMRHALAYLGERGVERVRLDATPLGRPVYEKLGFVAEYDVLRYGGVLPRSAGEPAGGIVGAGQGRLDLVRRLDASVTGANRSARLAELYRKRKRFRMAERDGAVTGFVCYRPGRLAWQIGPCLADELAGPLLFAWAFHWTQMVNVFVDVPEMNALPRRAAEAAGLTVQRTLTRMCRGPLPQEQTGRIWASSGPEMG